jgi:succinate dehydrogenase / fumarate reductase cytochrome b subunit
MHPNRPTSPHLQIYRWQMGSTLSILHRFTGIGLALGLVALSYWLMAIAGGEESYEAARRLLASAVGQLFLLGWTFAFLYHFFNGMRHLLWDAGYGFEKTQRRASGWFVVLAALGLTIGIWLTIWRGAFA